MSYKIAKGKIGEEEAARFLKKNGYRIVATNYRCRYGEIDIIAKDGDTIVFVEVKTRAGGAFGSPASGVDHKKQRRMITAGTIYLTENNLHDRPVRFDVVGVDASNGRLSAEIIKNAFDAWK